jgi:hypothetical protein
MTKIYLYNIINKYYIDYKYDALAFARATIERSYRAPCVVLVINDNPYGLMVALSYMCRTCP